MKFILVRHGETKANLGGIYSGWSNYNLTARGELQIDLLAGRLKYYDADIIYSSPLGRAMESAKIIAKVIKKEIEIVEELKEINFGIFDGKTVKEIEEDHLEEWQAWMDDYQVYKIPQGESLEDLIVRTKGFIDTIKNKEGTCIIVSHRGVIGSILAYLLDIEASRMWNFTCPPGTYMEIDHIDNFAYLRRITPSRI